MLSRVLKKILLIIIQYLKRNFISGIGRGDFIAVERIEQYRQQNGEDVLKIILKPTKKHIDGYFYAPAEAIDLVNSYAWVLHHNTYNNCYVVANNRYSDQLRFHQELCKFYHGYYVGCIDHINNIALDNTDKNLNSVTIQQNGFNYFHKGYCYRKRDCRFQVDIYYQDRHCSVFKPVKTEDEVCTQQYYVENIWIKEKLVADWYMFDFKKYRKGSEDILDLERTGVISEEEATYRHILKYSENAWYMLRYDLEQYFKDNRIPIPKYSLDENGFMIHPITGQKLCPFHK